MIAKEKGSETLSGVNCSGAFAQQDSREKEPPYPLSIRAKLLFLELNFLVTGAKLNCNTRGKYHSVPGEAGDCHKGPRMWRWPGGPVKLRPLSMRLQAPVLGQVRPLMGGGGGLHAPEMFGQRHSTSVINHLHQLRLSKGQMRRAPARSEGQRLGIHFLLMWMLKQGLALYSELPSFKLITTHPASASSMQD